MKMSRKWKILSIEEINSAKPVRSMVIAIEFNGRHVSSGGQTHRLVLCKCSCGTKFTTRVCFVTTGNTLSCGCLNIKSATERMTKYENNIKSINQVYHSMMQRCYKPSCPGYKHYGGRGVEVCEEWRNSYQSFLNWALISGYKKGLQLDKDKKGNGLLYSPNTCCWITRSENNKGRRDHLKYEFNGKIQSVAEISKELGISIGLFYKRRKQGKIGKELFSPLLKQE